MNAPLHRLGITCPGSPPRREALEQGLRWLEERGFACKLGRTVVPADGLHAGPPEMRAEELNAFLRDEEIDAILCARGGSGTLGILPYLDLGPAASVGGPAPAGPPVAKLPVAKPPVAGPPVAKPIIGMSDVTALHLALLRSGVRNGVSGSMVVQIGAGMPPYTEERWLTMVGGPHPAGPVPMPAEAALRSIPARPGAMRRSSAGVADSAEGILLPCNLSLLTALIGTSWIPPLDGAILLLEDIHESPQSLDRMVAQLSLSGAIDGLAGIILGEFTECTPRGEGVSEEDGWNVLVHWAGSLGVPALAGFPYGHGAVTCALPFGTRARMTCDPPALILADAR